MNKILQINIQKKKGILTFLKKKKTIKVVYSIFTNNLLNYIGYAQIFSSHITFTYLYFYKNIIVTNLKYLSLTKKNLAELFIFYISIVKSQIFSNILKNTTQSIWTKSVGSFVSEFANELFIKSSKTPILKKNFKKQHSYWWLYLKMYSQKFFNTQTLKPTRKGSTRYIFFFKGVFFFFLRLINFVWKLGILEKINYAIMDFNLPYFYRKLKKIKSIKKKLKKRLVTNFLNKKIP